MSQIDKEYLDASPFFLGAASAFGEVINDLKVLIHLAAIKGVDHSDLDVALASVQRRKDDNLAEGIRRSQPTNRRPAHGREPKKK